VIDLIRVGDAAGLRRLLDQVLRLSGPSVSLYDQAIAQCVEALVATGEGRFGDAETWAAKALETGRRISEAQAVTAFGMQMFCLRREQGRLREALPMLQHFMRTMPKSQTWQPGLMLLYAELDMRAECQAEFDSLPWHRLSTAPSGAATMTVVMFSAEACCYLGDVARAAQLYPYLLVHAGANLVADTPGPNLGAADRVLGNLATVMAQWDPAETHFEAALDIAGATAERATIARILADWSLAARAQGRSEQASTLAFDALAAAESARDPLGTAQAHNILGILARSRGDYAGAASQLERGLAISETLTDPSSRIASRIAALNNLAMARADSGDLAQAVTLAEQALAQGVAVGDRHREAALRNNLADLLHAAGRDEEAMAQLKQAVVIFAEIGVDAGDTQAEIWKLTEW